MRIIDTIKEKYAIHKASYEDVDMIDITNDVAYKANKTIMISAMISLLFDVFAIIVSILINESFAFKAVLTLSIINAVVVVLVGLINHNEGRNTKRILIFFTLANAFLLSIYTNYVGCAIFVLTIILTIQYFDTKLTLWVSVLSEIAYTLSIVVVSYLSYHYDNIFLGFHFISLDSLVRVGDNTMVTLENVDYSTFQGYLASQFDLSYIMFTMIVILTAIIAIRSAVLGKEMVFEEAKMMAAKTKVELENNEAKTRIMISQIQPHFIYNTLNTIYYLCEKEPLVAQEAIGDFSDYLRENLNLNSSKEVVPFSQELSHIEKYLSLEKMRFEDELNIEYDIQCTCFKVPSLSLQPLVENAVKHGLGKKSGGGTLKISTMETNECYEVKIQDDGVGFDVNKPHSNDRVHIGIENTKERLERMIGATLIMDSQIGAGSSMTIKIPKENYYEDIGR